MENPYQRACSTFMSGTLEVVSCVMREVKAKFYGLKGKV